MNEIWMQHTNGTWHMAYGEIHGRIIPICKINALSKPMFLNGKQHAEPNTNGKICKTCLKNSNRNGVN